MAVHGMLQIYSNDGSTRLFYDDAATPGTSYIVNETGLMNRADTQVYTYTGNKKFIGFATTANATEPTYAIGDSTPSIVAADYLNLYIVEEEIADVPRIIYNGEVIAELSDKEVTITCVGKKMLSDIVIVNPAVEEEVVPTDLTGYTVTVPAGWSASAGYGQFNIKPYIISANITYTSLNIGYTFNPGDGYFTNSNKVTFVSGSDEYNTYNNSSSFSFVVHGGTDVTNESLIQWLVDNNATIELIQEGGGSN